MAVGPSVLAGQAGSPEAVPSDGRAGRSAQQVVHVVLVGFGVVGVADVAAHGQAQQLAAEVVFQRGAGDLLAVVQVLWPNEPKNS